MIDEGQKWLITKQALQWKRKNFDVIYNSQLIGGNPNNAEMYGFSCWSGQEGIIAIRNPSDKA